MKVFLRENSLPFVYFPGISRAKLSHHLWLCVDCLEPECKAGLVEPLGEHGFLPANLAGAPGSPEGYFLSIVTFEIFVPGGR